MTHEEIYRNIADLAYEQSVKDNTMKEPTDCPYYNSEKTEGGGNEKNDKAV